MNHTVIFLSLAALDIENAMQWYETESLGLGDRFIEAILLTVQKIADHPERFTPTPIGESRIVLVKKFPYKIIFYLNRAMHRVEIIAVIHNKRHPRVWKKRI